MNGHDPVPALKRELGELLAHELRGWRATDVCELIGTEAARVSDLRRGQLDRFSRESLIRFATRLRLEVGITVTRSKRREAGSA